jgi:hypothetical protein
MNAANVASTAASGLPIGPLFYYRPDHNDHRFLEQYVQSEPFDAAVIPARYLAPYAAGSVRAQRSDGRELATALQAVSGPFIVDPDTPVLAHLTATSGEPTPRLRTMPHAQAVSLPVTLLSLAAPAAIRHFVTECLVAQRGASALAAPYFQFEQVGTGWHRLNLDLIAETVQQAGAREVVAFVQVPLERLASGELARSAPTYSGLGVDRIFIRVAGFDPIQSTQAEARAYRAAFDAFLNAGLEPIADCVGRFGLVVTAAGAGGFSGGSRHHQRIAAHPVYLTEEMTSDPCMYEVPQRWFAMDRARAQQATQAGAIPACADASCPALVPGAQPRDLKTHFIHYCVGRVRDVAATGAGGMRTSLTAHPAGTYTHAWLAAV